MKSFIEKLNLGDNNSFYVATHSTPDFEVDWHHHPELELILFKEGFGNAFIGDHVSEFKAGDIYFLGVDVPHTFQKANKKLFVSAVVIQFKEDFWGYNFITLPECKGIKALFEASLHGLKITGTTKELLSELILTFETLFGLPRIIHLAKCLQLIEERKEYELLSAHTVKEFDPHNKERIYKVHQYTTDYYFEQITLKQVANVASMSIPAFCSYFKRCTKKTYIEFLNEVRIENACKLLIETEKSINEISYNSGFNTLPNFNKQFHKIKKMTPSHYRKLFQNNLIIL